MKLTNVMFDLDEGTASLGLFGDIDEDTQLRPPHVQITVNVSADGDRSALRHASIRAALGAIDKARAALEAELP